MSLNIKHLAHRGVNKVLEFADVQVVRKSRRPFTDYRDFIPFKETVEAAERAGLSVGDYIEAVHNQPGSAQRTIDQLVALGALAAGIERICEIGPGSGRYLERTVRLCSPKHYEIYETAPTWEQWLVERYAVVARPVDGRSLAHTQSESVDLVHAHKVLPGQPSLTICNYYAEMARVVRPGGRVVFDIVSEDCLDDVTLQRWLDSGLSYQHYPCLMPKQFTIEYFARRGFNFLGSFLVPMEPGTTECFAFARPQA